MMLYGTPIGVVFLCIAVLAFVILAFTGVFTAHEKSKNSKQPVLTVNVVIDGLQEDTHTYHKPLYRSLFIETEGEQTKHAYFLTKEQFDSMEPGWTGKLSFQGTEFISFERAADSPEGRPKDTFTRADKRA